MPFYMHIASFILSIVAECLSRLLLAIIGSLYIRNRADILNSVCLESMLILNREILQFVIGRVII